jgi:proteic killer suppression protein
MIRSFRSEETRQVLRGRVSRAYPPDIQSVARRKLRQLNRAVTLADLTEPPGNRFEALRGRRQGEYSIRINDQWRVVFRWDSQPYDVAIEDYHDERR